MNKKIAKVKTSAILILLIRKTWVNFGFSRQCV